MNDKIGLDIEEILLIIEKLYVNKKEEELSTEELDSIYMEIEKNYKTGNGDKINLLTSELLNNLKTVSKIHDKDIFVLEKKVERHTELELKNERILSEGLGERNNNEYRL